MGVVYGADFDDLKLHVRHCKYCKLHRRITNTKEGPSMCKVIHPGGEKL